MIETSQGHTMLERVYVHFSHMPTNRIILELTTVTFYTLSSNLLFLSHYLSAMKIGGIIQVFASLTMSIVQLVC